MSVRGEAQTESPLTFRLANRGSSCGPAITTIGSMSRSRTVASRLSYSVRASTPAQCASTRRASPISRSTTPETLDFKQARLAESAIVVPVVYIPGNYVTDGILRLLTTHSFDAGLPTYLIWEGNTMYLTRPAVLGVLRDFARARG